MDQAIAIRWRLHYRIRRREETIDKFRRLRLDNIIETVGKVEIGEGRRTVNHLDVVKIKTVLVR